jgi:hypothetical protein
MKDKLTPKTPVSNRDPSPPNVTVHDQGVTPIYTNFCRVNTTPEEIVLDFALNADTAAPNPTIHVSQRIVCSFYTAKRLLYTLSMAIERHEQTFGPIEVDVSKRVRSG